MKQGTDALSCETPESKCSGPLAAPHRPGASARAHMGLCRVLAALKPDWNLHTEQICSRSDNKRAATASSERPPPSQLTRCLGSEDPERAPLPYPSKSGQAPPGQALSRPQHRLCPPEVGSRMAAPALCVGCIWP